MNWQEPQVNCKICLNDISCTGFLVAVVLAREGMSPLKTCLNFDGQLISDKYCSLHTVTGTPQWLAKYPRWWPMSGVALFTWSFTWSSPITTIFCRWLKQLVCRTRVPLQGQMNGKRENDHKVFGGEQDIDCQVVNSSNQFQSEWRRTFGDA